MSSISVKTSEGLGSALVHLVMRRNNALAEKLWIDLVDETPVKTGTARWSWIYSPSKPATRKPPIQEYPYPPKPDFWKYTMRWQQWYITNNQDYIEALNNGSSQQNTNIGWIQSVTARAVSAANSGNLRYQTKEVKFNG